MADRRTNPTLHQVELSVLLESMPEAVLIFDRNGRVAEFNQAALQLLGMEPQVLRGKSVADLSARISPSSKGKALDASQLAVSRALQGEHIFHEERMFVFSEGRQVEVVISAHPMRNQSGVRVGALVLIRDVSEIHFLQRRLADTAKHLAIGQMAADIAHDFNNVLGTISQAAAVLEATKNPGLQDRKLYLGMIQNNVKRGIEIIQRMTEHIRGSKDDHQRLQLSTIIAEALELTRPAIKKRGDIAVEIDLEPSTPVLGNAADLRRSFTNLILNAVEAMTKGGQLSLRCRKNNGTVIATVTDTGSGISAADQKKIFSPYFTTKKEGTGLGLVGAHNILQAHGGIIRFNSELGKGTQFTIELPATQAPRKKAA